MRSEKPFFAAKTIFAIFVMFLLVSVAATQAHARKFKVLHTFHGANGAGPLGVLVRDAAGNLYGTTGGGGLGKCYSGYTCGTAFKLDKTGKQVWLHSFNGANGMEPAAGMLRDAAGDLYGTTELGGDTTCYSLGCGTVFRLSNAGAETVLYKFKGTPDGFFPTALLVEDAAGTLYGTTPLGGSSGGYGTVFELNKARKETILHSFAGPPGVARSRF